MRVWVFAVALITMLVLQTSRVVGLISVPALDHLAPNLAGILLAFVALFAPRTAALWGAWTIGLLMDLSPPTDTPVLVGPRALGYVLAAFFILQIRTMVFRRRVITLAAMAVIGLFISSAVEIGLHTVRSWYPDVIEPWASFRPTAALLRSFAVAIYTGLLAIPIGWLLLRTLELWNFETISDRRYGMTPGSSAGRR